MSEKEIAGERLDAALAQLRIWRTLDFGIVWEFYTAHRLFRADVMKAYCWARMQCLT